MTSPPASLPRLLVILDRAQAGDVVDVAARACAGGARLLQWRDKTLGAGRLYAIGQKLREVARAHGARLIVNDRADVALTLGADGVHRPSTGLPMEALRALMGPEAILGASAHAGDALAALGAASYVTWSPIFLTKSKPGYGPALGVASLARAAARSPVPVFALGGITPSRVGACVDAGAHGVAVMGGIMRARDPEAATRAYLEALTPAGSSTRH